MVSRITREPEGTRSVNDDRGLYQDLSVEHHISLGSGGNPPEIQQGHLVTGSSEHDRTGKTRVMVTKCERRID